MNTDFGYMSSNTSTAPPGMNSTVPAATNSTPFSTNQNGSGNMGYAAPFAPPIGAPAPMNMGFQQWGYNNSFPPQPNAQQSSAPIPSMPPMPVENPARGSITNNKADEPTITSPPKTRGRWNMKDQLDQLQKQLADEKAARASVEAELKLKTDECVALKASTNGIVTAAVQLQPLLQTGYVMPETLQQFNYFVYWAQMKVFEEQQREQQFEKEKEAKKKQLVEKAAEEQRRKLAEEEARRVAQAKAKQEAEARKAKADAEAAKKVEAEKARAAAAAVAAAKAKQEAEAAAAREAQAAAAAAAANNAPAYDPHAAPVVFGGQSRLNLVPEAYLQNKQNSAELKNILGVKQQQQPQQHQPQQQPVVEQPKPKPVQKPKPTSWAGLVAHNIDDDQNVSPTNSATNPNIIPNANTNVNAAVSKAPATKPATTKPVQRDNNNKGKFNKNNSRYNNNRNGSNNSSAPRDRNNRWSKNGRRNSRDRKQNRHQPAPEVAEKMAQYQKDIALARQLQANIDAYDNSTTIENEWQSQSRKGAASRARTSNAREITVGN